MKVLDLEHELALLVPFLNRPALVVEVSEDHPLASVFAVEECLPRRAGLALDPEHDPEIPVFVAGQQGPGVVAPVVDDGVSGSAERQVDAVAVDREHPVSEPLLIVEAEGLEPCRSHDQAEHEQQDQLGIGRAPPLPPPPVVAAGNRCGRCNDPGPALPPFGILVPRLAQGEAGEGCRGPCSAAHHSARPARAGRRP